MSPAAGIRNTTDSDDPSLARLLDLAYTDTIDHGLEADHGEELRTWRTVDGADDGASFVAVGADGSLAGACLIGRELGAPFLYEIVTHPDHRRSGLATALLAHSLQVLEVRGESMIAAWVTTGNTASENLLNAHGFCAVTPPVDATLGVGYYRAASALRHATVPGGAVVAATSTTEGPTLWVIDRDRATAEIEIAGTKVRIEYLGRDDARLSELAGTAMPIRGAAWLLRQRQGGGGQVPALGG